VPKLTDNPFRQFSRFERNPSFEPYATFTPMNAEIEASIITGVCSIAAALLTVAYPLYRKNLSLQGHLARFRENQDAASLVACGLAVAYYANFVSTIFEILKNNEILVCLNPNAPKDERKVERFNKQKVRVFCLVPAKLVNERIVDCENELAKYEKGAIIRGERLRDFTINYSIASRGDERELLIYDVARPVFAIRDYLREFRNLRESDAEWLSVSDRAISSFTKSLERTRENSGVIGNTQFTILPIR
jgi:hypothetical protein